MKSYILISVFIFMVSSGFAQSTAPAVDYSQLSFTRESTDVLEETADIKKLILKYDSAPAAQKPAIKKEIEQLETQNEAARITKQEERIKRQENKIKDLKKNLEERKKNSKQNVSTRVEHLVSAQSVEKIKNESVSKKAIDKVKNQR